MYRTVGKQLAMKAITIHPESAEQFKTVKAVLKALNVPFEAQPTDLPKHIVKSIDKSLHQLKAGKTISLETFKEKHCRKK